MKVPVTVVTGALGAGKTTLLNAGLRSGAIRNAAVVVNEFGAVGIDNELIEAASEEVVLLPGGCVCCQVRADLAEALLRLERGVAHGEITAFERVVVETSGLAEPGPILQLFAESPLLVGRYRLEAVVCLVDALLGEAAIAAEGSAYRQVLLADRLIVVKGEAAAADALETLEARVAAISPYAEIVRAPRGTAHAAWFGPAPVAPGRLIPVAAYRAAHDASIESFVLEWSEAQPLAAIGAWLHGLAETCGARLLRVKGIVAAEGVAEAIALHAIQHLVAPPEFLPTPAGGSRVVFITRGLEPGDVAPGWRCATVRRVESEAALRPARAASTRLPQPLSDASSGATVRP